MISEYVRELTRYTEKELKAILHCSNVEFKNIVKLLKDYGILKTVKATDLQKDFSNLQDTDFLDDNTYDMSSNYFFVFKFVGIIVIAGRILKCYPKYLISAKKPKEELKQVIKVIEKHDSNEQELKMFTNNENGSMSSILPVMLYLLHDYYDNGLYYNTQNIIEINGEGETYWDKTINESFMVLSKGRPYYPELYTKKRIIKETDFLRRVHASILTEISRTLNSSDLSYIFDIEGVELSEESLDELGDTEYILYRINKELNVQFNTRKQYVLKALYTYISNIDHISDLDCLSIYGTTSFYNIWEDVFKDILNDKYNTALAMLSLPQKLKNKYNPNALLKDLINKPYWTKSKTYSDKTLEPDILSVTDKCFMIFDAKYYNIQLNEGEQPRGNPGIESITKQYLYELAYSEFIYDHGFEKIRNCFILPTEKDQIINCGNVQLHMFDSLNLENIQIRLIPATLAYDLYLSNQKLDLSLIDL